MHALGLGPGGRWCICKKLCGGGPIEQIMQFSEPRIICICSPSNKSDIQFHISAVYDKIAIPVIIILRLNVEYTIHALVFPCGFSCAAPFSLFSSPGIAIEVAGQGRPLGGHGIL